MKAGMFGMVPYKILTDKSLSDGDKVMYAFIQTHVDSEGKCKEDEDYFAKERAVDPRTIRSQIARLVNTGTILKTKNSKEGFDLRIPTDLYFTNIKDSVSQTSKQILDYWNSVLQCDVPYTTVLERSVKRRLQKFSPEQLFRAVQGRIAFVRTNPWFMKDENRGLRSNIILLLQSDDEVEKYLAYEIADLSLVQINHESKTKTFDSSSNRTVLE